jgi:hypothetical protein
MAEQGLEEEKKPAFPLIVSRSAPPEIPSISPFSLYSFWGPQDECRIGTRDITCYRRMLAASIPECERSSRSSSWCFLFSIEKRIGLGLRALLSFDFCLYRISHLFIGRVRMLTYCYLWLLASVVFLKLLTICPFIQSSLSVCSSLCSHLLSLVCSFSVLSEFHGREGPGGRRESKERGNRTCSL